MHKVIKLRIYPNESQTQIIEQTLGTLRFLYNKYLEYNGKKITCKVDDMEDFCGIDSSCFIKYVTFYNKNECKSFSADVNEYLDISEQKFIVLDICDFYEEK